MTAKTTASKPKASPAKAPRVVKRPPAPVLEQAAVAPIEASIVEAVATVAEPVAAPVAELLETAPPAAPAEPVEVSNAETDTKPCARAIPLAAAFTKELNMATAFETTQDAVRTAASTLNTQAESAINSGKAAMEQVAAKSKEAVEAGMKSMDELASMHRGNIDALIASAKAATTGVEQVMTHLTEASKKSFEDTKKNADASRDAEEAEAKRRDWDIN